MDRTSAASCALVVNSSRCGNVRVAFLKLGRVMVMPWRVKVGGFNAGAAVGGGGLRAGGEDLGGCQEEEDEEEELEEEDMVDWL